MILTVMPGGDERSFSLLPRYGPMEVLLLGHQNHLDRGDAESETRGKGRRLLEEAPSMPSATASFSVLKVACV